MPPRGLDASTLALRLGGALIAYVEAHNLGRATGADGGYEIARTGGKATTLVPDAAFIRAERLPPHVSFDTSKAVPFAPRPGRRGRLAQSIRPSAGRES